MTKEDYKKRLIVFFSEKLDADKNGYISWDDYRLMALRTTFQQNNGEYNEDIHRKYLTHSKQMWESLCNDVGGNKDGKVHFQDLVNFLYELTSRTRHFEELPDFLQNLAIEVFHMIDKKCDMMWDRDEYRFGSVIWCYVTELKEIDKAFESMLSSDDRKRGGITLERFKELVTEFFTSLDANSPSRNIFGPLDPNMADEILCRAAPVC
ncbi:sarcoplasmic calcium-binding protein, alpha-B and -A chains [Nephila pilipes]|uniref:Sarcoplasmic calcium-binding protein, alpha-B and -A chains n=2 Tax=Nephilidae TaxID=450948 RepID=A0A8X6N312_NEPPI|nr:sarcoplasmic calcium-binding protein, alpha-B and -A chains [Nephila pilipes]